MSFTIQEITDALDTYMRYLAFRLHRSDPRYATVTEYFNNKENLRLEIIPVSRQEYHCFFHHRS